jgi:PAS domain-containing protein
MQDLKSNKPRSISRTLSIGLTITLVLVAGLSLGVNFILASREAKAEMETRVEDYISALTDAFKQGTSYSEFRPLFDVLAGMSEKIASQMKSLKLIQYAVDNSSVATYWLDPDACITYASEAACRGLGYAKDELLKLSAATEHGRLWS